MGYGGAGEVAEEDRGWGSTQDVLIRCHEVPGRLVYFSIQWFDMTVRYGIAAFPVLVTRAENVAFGVGGH